MKKLFLLVALWLFPLSAFAHEVQHFRINDVTYKFVVGSLNEPLIVDDKSGVDLRVAILTGDEEVPVEGLQDTLQVEVSAASKSRVFDLSTQYGTPGAYKVIFFPTTSDALTYRVFGLLDGTEIDLSFTCHTGGHVMGSAADENEVRMSDTVTRVLQRGSFGCPSDKEIFGFPERSADLRSVSQQSNLPTVLSVVALLVSCCALWRTCNKSD